MTPASKHLAHIRAIASGHLHSGRGAGCRNFSRLPARGGAFSLDILFYRTSFFIEPVDRSPPDEVVEKARKSDSDIS